MIPISFLLTPVCESYKMVETETTMNLEDVFNENDKLKKEIRRDLLALDLRLSLFVGAVQSFKYESLLKPVPALYRKSDGEVDIDDIRKLVCKLPELPLLDVDNADPELTTLLKTIVLNNNQQLSSISLEELKKQVGELIELKIAPRWVFQIDHITRNQAWERRKASSSSFYAYHGSRFENFHSILNLGLHQHLNKVSYH